MNKKGQSLIIFVIILPVILLFVIYVIVASNNYLEKNHLRMMVNDNLKIILNKDIKDLDKINNTLKDNENEVLVNIDNDIIKINVKSLKKGLFNNIYKISEIKVSYCGNYVTKEIYECS